MPITKDECAEIQKEVGTIGGDTYRIRKFGEDEFKPLCFRLSQTKGRKRVADDQGRLLRCANTAGYGTNHSGTGSCSSHGPSDSNTENIISSAIKHGRNAVITKNKLADKIDKYLAKDKAELRNLSYELSATRVIFKEFMDVFPNADDDTFGIDLQRMTSLVGTIGTLVDKISRIETRNALTLSQIMYFRAVVADILFKYIKDPTISEMAAAELVQRVGGNQEYPVVKTN